MASLSISWLRTITCLVSYTLMLVLARHLDEDRKIDKYKMLTDANIDSLTNALSQMPSSDSHNMTAVLQALDDLIYHGYQGEEDNNQTLNATELAAKFMYLGRLLSDIIEYSPSIKDRSTQQYNYYKLWSERRNAAPKNLLADYKKIQAIALVVFAVVILPLRAS